jgi:hypothetical protein
MNRTAPPGKGVTPDSSWGCQSGKANETGRSVTRSHVPVSRLPLEGRACA